jgi:uncharacterized membrane protein
MDVSPALYLHVTGGAVALVSGGTAMLVRKGEAVHRLSGNVFFVSMLVMTIAGFVVAIAREQAINISASTVTFYMIVTSWVAATRRDGEIGRFETVAMIGGLCVLAAAAVFAVTDTANAPVHYVFGAVAAIGVLSDAKVIWHKGIAGARRIARHLWRMSFAMLVATGAYFVGQPRFVPAILQETRLNIAIVLLVLALLVFWLVRVRFTKWWRDEPKADAAVRTGA